MANKVIKTTIASALAVVSAAAYVPGTAIGSVLESTALTASAESYYGDFVYENLASGTISITKYNGHDSYVVIPSEINGQAVTNIGENAFFKNAEMTDVQIPSSVTEISNFAFFGCSALKTVYVPDSVTSIGRGAFASCSELTSVRLSNNLTEIKDGTFQRCSALTDMNVPARVTSIGGLAFLECTSLTNVTLPGGVNYMGTKVFQKCEALESVNIPGGVAELKEYTFGGCTNLNNVKLSSGLKVIGDSVFSNCSSLENIELPNTLTTIETNAFANCKMLKRVEMPDSVTTLGYYVFTNCHALTDLKLSKGLKTISKGDFILTGVTSVEIPEGVTAIEDLAFYGCTSLKNVTLPITLESIGRQVFKSCTDLNIKYTGTQAQWGHINIDDDNADLREASLNFGTAVSNPDVTFQKGNGAVKLSWTGVQGAQGYAICGYSGGKWKILAKGPASARSYVVNNLKAGTDYTVAVIAMINGEWNMDFSKAITVTPNAESASKYPVVKYQVKGSQYRLSWTAADNAQGYAVAQYKDGKWKLLKAVDANTLTYTSTSLPAGTYNIAVAAKINGKWDTTDIKTRGVSIVIK